MTGITVDVGAGNMAMDAPASLDPQNPITSGDHGVPEGHVMVGPSAYDHRLTAPMLLSPRYFRRDPSADHHQPLETANFLRTCGLCNRRLAPGRDIYMYRYQHVIWLPSFVCVCVCFFFLFFFPFCFSPLGIGGWLFLVGDSLL